MTVVKATQVVNGSLDVAWEAVSNMEAVKDWHPNVARVTVMSDQVSGVGAARRVEFHDGNSVVETVIEERELAFTTVDMTESPPLRKALVTISTKALSPETTAVTFSIDYQVSYGPLGWLLDVAMLRRMFSRVFAAALDGLSYYLESGEKVVDSVPVRGA